MTTPEARLAAAFSALIRRDLTKAQLAETVRRNKTYDDDVCATHDFIDANMTMHEAFTAVFNRDPLDTNDEGGMTDADIALWGAAWSLAKASGFTL